MFINEIKLMINLDHPNIISVNEIFSTSKSCQLVMDICYGGNLFENIIQGQGYPEAEALS